MKFPVLTFTTMIEQLDNAVVPQKKTRDNRSAGHDWELECAEAVREVGFPHVVTCRTESCNRDAQKIDLMNVNEAVNGRLPYNIQCKNSCQMVPYHVLLTRGRGKTVKPRSMKGASKIKLVHPIPTTEGVVNVILHKYTSNKNESGRFVTQGKYAILKMDDFLKMAEELNRLKSGS